MICPLHTYEYGVGRHCFNGVLSGVLFKSITSILLTPVDNNLTLQNFSDSFRILIDDQNFSKIHRYSSTEVNRANDKQCHRKRPDLKFDPLPALAHIDRLRRGVNCRDQEYVDAVVQQYNQVGLIILKSRQMSC